MKHLVRMDERVPLNHPNFEKEFEDPSAKRVSFNVKSPSTILFVSAGKSEFKNFPRYWKYFVLKGDKGKGIRIYISFICFRVSEIIT